MSWEFDYLIVGAGFTGSVIAERLSSQLNRTCLIVDRRNHVGGNCYDYHDRHGVLVHKYGAHYFRTDSDHVRDYLSRFTGWNRAEYKILSWTNGRYWQFPINLNTFEQLIGRPSTTDEMERTLAEWRISIPRPANSEDVVVSQAGVRLYEMFFEGYTRKQWGRDPRELDASVCGRIPLRVNRDDRYLSEKFQAMPDKGYTKMFERMLSNPKIKVMLNTDFQEVRAKARVGHIIYTGTVDEYYDFCYGRLPYRSLRFELETKHQEWFQSVVQINYPNDYEFTRCVEIKHVTRQELPVTTIMREYPEEFLPGREPYYPIPAPDSATLYRQYQMRAEKEPNVTFAGRLGTYRYYNMDQVVGAALAEYEKLASGKHRGCGPGRNPNKS